MVGVGGVVIQDGKALLIRRGSEPLKGEWSIPGGMLEVGETLKEGVKRELLEETGLHVQVLDLIEVFERIFPQGESAPKQVRATSTRGKSPAQVKDPARPLYHFVILDYLCKMVSGEPRAGGDVTDIAFAAEEELGKFHLTPTATRVLKEAFRMANDAARKGP